MLLLLCVCVWPVCCYCYVCVWAYMPMRVHKCVWLNVQVCVHMHADNRYMCACVHIYAGVCECVTECVWLHMQVCTCVQDRGQPQVLAQELSTLRFEMGFSLGLGAHLGLTDWWASEINPLLPPQHWDHRCAPLYLVGLNAGLTGVQQALGRQSCLLPSLCLPDICFCSL